MQIPQPHHAPATVAFSGAYTRFHLGKQSVLLLPSHDPCPSLACTPVSLLSAAAVTLCPSPPPGGVPSAPDASPIPHSPSPYQNPTPDPRHPSAFPAFPRYQRRSRQLRPSQQCMQHQTVNRRNRDKLQEQKKIQIIHLKLNSVLHAVRNRNVSR